ncbi:MAG: Holliday junction resolvase RuvX [Coriobacteriia bacterium]|nr:Holliday junction resolvase RuvX [Coriobacteriia bacterium]
MSRLIGFDIGQKRMGVAISDPNRTIASPLAVLDVVELRADQRGLRRLIEDYEIHSAVVGLPLTMKGEEGPQARQIREFVADYLAPLGIAIHYIDERLSSKEAKKAMREAGTSEKEARGRVDMVAAALLLQTYMDQVRMD